MSNRVNRTSLNCHLPHDADHYLSIKKNVFKKIIGGNTNINVIIIDKRQNRTLI